MCFRGKNGPFHRRIERVKLANLTKVVGKVNVLSLKLN